MKNTSIIPAIFSVLVLFSLSSCTIFSYGLSTKVKIESEAGISDKVTITAIGSKKTTIYENVTLPYKMKVKHSNLPLRVTIDSKEYLYPYISINSKEVGGAEGLAYILGGSGMASSLIVGSALEIWGGGLDSKQKGEMGAMLGVSALMVGLAAISPKKVPYQKLFRIQPLPITEENAYRASATWRNASDILDVYELINNDQYELAKGKASYLLKNNPTGELFYLKGVSEYKTKKYKDAIKDLRHALYLGDMKEDIKQDIRNYLAAAEESRQLQLERRQEIWASVIGSALQITSAALQYSQMQTAQKKLGYQNGKNVDYLLDPRYAMMQVHQQYYNEYLQMTNGGQTMSYDEWFQKIKGPALAEEWRIEHGLSNTDNGNDEDEYKGELSPDQYEAAYRRWEQRVQDWFSNLTSSGYKIEDKKGNIKGKTGSDMKGWAYVGNQSGLKKAQNEMRKIRLEAEKYGVHITQSKWETATSSY